MSSIKSNEFLNKLYGFLDNQRNQGTYIIEFFNAAGSHYFVMPLAYKDQTNEALEGKSHYAKDRLLIQETKELFLNPINLDGLVAFIDKTLSANKLVACMAEFGIPSGAEQDKIKFAHAFAAQFSLFVTTPDDDIDSAVWEMYQTLLAGQPISADDISGLRYAGDDVLVEFGNRRHEADCYEIIHHEWKLQNRGTREWHDRKLVLMNQAEIHPRPVQTVIPVPDTGPGVFTKIATDIDTCGFEGNFECKWEMQDADDDNCFPNKRWDFNIRIQVTFHTSDEGDTRG